MRTDLATYRGRHPGIPEDFVKSTGTRIWKALAESKSLYQFSQRLRRVRESLNGDPLMTRRVDKLMRRRQKITEHLRRRGVPKTSVGLDQKFKWLDGKYFQTRSFMSELGGKAFANAWAIARNFWRFLTGAKRAGRSPLEISGVGLDGHPWLEVVNLRAFGAHGGA